MCIAGMVTMATVNIRPGVITIQPPLTTASTASSTTVSAVMTSTTLTVTDCPYVLALYLSSLKGSGRDRSFVCEKGIVLLLILGS